MKQIISILFVLAISCHSCFRPSQSEKDLRLCINKTMQLRMFETVQQSNLLLPYEEFRQLYSNLSIVYLQDGCSPCYPEYIKWQKKLESIDVPDNYSVLFIINGVRYEDFMTEVLNIDYVEDRYYTIMDPEGKYLEANKDIPRWIIDASVLIDSENKIRMVGAPWANTDMTELFYKTVSSNQ